MTPLAPQLGFVEREGEAVLLEVTVLFRNGYIDQGIGPTGIALGTTDF